MVRLGTQILSPWIAGPFLYQLSYSMLTDFILISFIEPDISKTLKNSLSGYEITS